MKKRNVFREKNFWKNFFLVSFAAVMILSAGIGKAWAYFTTYAEARGGYTIELGDETNIREEFSSWTKHVTISNNEGAAPVYVRVKAFCGSEYELTFSDGSGKWAPGSEGYYYYSDIVAGGGVTDEIQIKIENVPTDITDPTSFNVVVIYESTPVRYDAMGSPYADWSVILDSKSAEGGR